MSRLALALFLAVRASGVAGRPSARTSGGAEANPPTWPASVRVFSPDDADIAATVEAAFALNGGHDPANNGEFSDARFAFLFEPGEYTVDVPVGFYTQVIGLGTTPDDVVFSGSKGVYSEEGDYDFQGGALCSFWRSAENFKNEAAYPWWSGAAGMLWAVSQASPLRRVHATGDLLLFQYTYGDAAGYASGGYLANSQVDGTVQSGSQQQWLTRSSSVGAWTGAVWNMVFVGVDGAPTDNCGFTDGGLPNTVVDAAPVVAEKPFITIDDDGLFSLVVPAPRFDTSGPTAFDGLAANDLKISFESVYVADNTTDTAATINAKLGQGLHVVLGPGIYSLESALELTFDNQVLLGLGLATLVSASGDAVVRVGDVDGVRVAGVLLQAGPSQTSALLDWGTGSHSGDPTNPGVMSDIFARVGGPDAFPVTADVMVAVHSGNVVGDNLWLWRADHTVSGAVTGGDNPCESGLVVDGEDVTMYALAVEHTLGDLVAWNGDGGRTFFYQSELPYDVTQEQFGDPGFVSYRVGDNVTSHASFGVGVYHFFRDYAVTVASAIAAPTSLASSFVNPVSVFLSGLGTITHVLNEEGDATSPSTSSITAYVC